jgi:hypothetical protein
MLPRSLTSGIVWFHRWVGVVLCLLFAAWFLSGAVMIYVPFPSLDRADAARHADPIAFDAVAIGPQAAVVASGLPEPVSARLVSAHGAPRWLVYDAGGDVAVIEARHGRSAGSIAADDARDIAARFASQPVASVTGPLRDDQWTVANEFDPLRPFYRARLTDDAGTELYVSARTGEVVQQTTRRERAWNYVGAVVHWIYPTVLRRHWTAWDQTVWWLSLVGTALGLAGVWLGVTRIAGRQRNGTWRWSAYRGWLRWHHVLGLTAGALALTWVFSGWLSMDHHRLFSSPDPTPEQSRRYAGPPLASLLDGLAPASLAVLGPATSAEFRAAGGRSWVSVSGPNAPRTFEVARNEIVPVASVPEDVISRAVGTAWSTAVLRAERVTADDAYTHLRDGSLPDTTVRVELDDSRRTWVHVDAATGAIVGVMDRSRRVYRWLFNGLHSFDVPPLVTHRPLWDALMLLGLAAGLVFIVTSVIVGVRRVRTKARTLAAARHPADVTNVAAD